MSPFSHDFIKREIDLVKYQQCLNSHSAWFLDIRASILVYEDIPVDIKRTTVYD